MDQDNCIPTPKLLPNLTDAELFGLARRAGDRADRKNPNDVMVLTEIAAECRRRGFFATEDYLLQLAAPEA